MTDTTLAYLAGVMNSDGTIGIKRNTYSMRVVGDSTQATYSERIHIRQVERGALDVFAETFGGNIGVTDPYSKRGRPLWNWGQTDRKAAATLAALLPYLRIKRQHAENCLHLRELKEASKIQRVALGRGHVGASVRSPEISIAMEACFLRAKALNRVGI